MSIQRIIQLADKFSEQLEITKSAQVAAQPATPEKTVAPNYNRIAQELNSVIQGFLSRNQMKMATTQPYIQQEAGNQKGSVTVGFIIPTNEYNEYLRKLHNEIQKLQQRYPGVTLRAAYDTNDPRRAKI